MYWLPVLDWIYSHSCFLLKMMSVFSYGCIFDALILGWLSLHDFCELKSAIICFWSKVECRCILLWDSVYCCIFIHAHPVPSDCIMFMSVSLSIYPMYSSLKTSKSVCKQGQAKYLRNNRQKQIPCGVHWHLWIMQYIHKWKSFVVKSEFISLEKFVQTAHCVIWTHYVSCNFSRQK